MASDLASKGRFVPMEASPRFTATGRWRYDRSDRYQAARGHERSIVNDSSEAMGRAMQAKFPFNDLSSFKDYIAFVRMCSPDQFPTREGVSAESQWTLELAFQGLRQGLVLASKQVKRDGLAEASRLVDDAYEHYRAGNRKEGFESLHQLRKLL